MKTRVQIHDLEFTPIIDPTLIADRINSMGTALLEEYKQEVPIFLGLLKGGFIFLADLVRAYHGPCEIAFMRLASYSGVESTGQIEQVLPLDTSIEGRVVIVTEDIVDTGNTIHWLIDHLQSLGPKKIVVATLLHKPEAAKKIVPLDYVGFEIPNRFVVGCGLDYNQLGRNLDGIYQLKP